MVGFIFGVVVLIVMIALFRMAKSARRTSVKVLADGNSTKAGDLEVARVFLIGGGVVAAVGAFLLLLFSMLFSLDVGESAVVRSISGTVDGQVTEAGWHLKAPWEDTVTYEIRNQRVVYVNPQHSTGDNSGGNSDGREVNVNDKDGVSTDVDVTIRYNISPASVVSIYKNFKTVDNLKSILIFNDLRDAVRSGAGRLHTLEVLSNHPKYAADVKATLQQKWAKYGIEVDEVSIQQTIPPKSVANAYATAQNSQIEVQKATNDLNAVKVAAQQKVVQAQAIADANNILAKSLSKEILQQKYIDALKAGTVYVVPSGSTPLINTSK